MLGNELGADGAAGVDECAHGGLLGWDGIIIRHFVIFVNRKAIP
jgi:hypothetical protein